MSKFDSIRPYEDHEVEKVLLDLAKDKDVIKTILTVNKNKWLQNIPMIEKLVSLFLRRKIKNIKTTLLLDSKNEEAMYILIDLELERSNFSKVQDLKKDFKKICNTLCEKLTSIDTRLKDFEKKDAS